MSGPTNKMTNSKPRFTNKIFESKWDWWGANAIFCCQTHLAAPKHLGILAKTFGAAQRVGEAIGGDSRQNIWALSLKHLAALNDVAKMSKWFGEAIGMKRLQKM